ncbi:MAG: hypothetical protein O7F08_13390 [Deltaproteobacteria bacterium]|nr:hypothetical protein [Deltaproteobacteria bacterium]
MDILRYTFLSLVVCGTAVAQAESCVADGKHFRVVCHFDDKAVTRQALAVVEAVWSPTLKVLGVRPSRSKHKLLAVHLYRNAADYVAAEAKLTAGEFKRNLAFAHFGSKTAHVAVQPNLSEAFLRDRGLNYQTLRLLIHEAAHLVRYHTTPNYRSHPDWYTEGSASWLEVTVLKTMGHLTDSVADPHFSDMIFRGQRLLSENKFPSLSAILRDEAVKLELFDRYSVHWLLFDFLYTTERKTTDWWVANMRRLGGGKSLAVRLADKLAKKLRGKKFDSLAARFQQHVKDLEPQWEEKYRSLETGKKDWIVTAFDTVNAVAWRTEAAGEEPWTLTGAATVLPGKKTQLNLLLGRRPKGFVAISLAAGSGVTVFDHEMEGNRWTTLAFARSPALAVAKRVSFRVSVADGRLRIVLNGEQVLETEVKVPMAGEWGVGALAGSSGVWHDVKLKRAKR